MPALIDTQGPLNRRKALIAKIMAQLQGGGSPEPGPNVAPTRSAASRSAPVPSASGGMSIRPGNLEARSALIPSLGIPKFNAPWDPQAQREVPQPAPPPEAAPPPQAGPPPAPDPEPSPAPVAVAPWQAGGFVSEEMYNRWNALNESDRQRIMQNPVTYRRYFA